jgi:hypothetical protein
MRIIKFISMLLVFGSLQVPAALGSTSKGFGEIEYKGMRGPTKDEERKAIGLAKVNSLKNHAATFSKSRYGVFSEVENDLVAKIDEVVLNFEVIDEETDKTSKRFRVFIEATLNDNLIESVLDNAGGGQAAVSAEPSYIAGVVIAREIASVKQYDEKRQSLSQVNAEANESVQQSADGLDVSESVDVTVVETTGGTVEKKADALNYRVFSADGVSSAITNVLSEFNFAYVSIGMFDGLDVSPFLTDFASGGDVNQKTIKDAARSIKSQGVSYFSIYKMTTSPPKEDPTTLQPRVDVTVSAEVYDLTKLFPVSVAAVAGKPFAGLGVDNQVAQTNALNKAGAETAKMLVDILRSKGIR